MVTLLLAAAAIFAAPAARPYQTPRAAAPHIDIRVDSAHSRIIVTAGPFNLPAMDPRRALAFVLCPETLFGLTIRCCRA